MYYPNSCYSNGDRQIVPFLFGSLVGGAAVGLTRPRPIYNVSPRPYYPGPYYPGPYYNQNYSYYMPYYPYPRY